jgi:hypothetical protein
MRMFYILRSAKSLFNIIIEKTSAQASGRRRAPRHGGNLIPAARAVKGTSMTGQPAEIPTRAVRDYLSAFDLAAVFVTAPKGETPVGIGAGTESPADAEACWWTEGIEAAEAVVEMAVGCDLRSAPREGDLIAVTVAVAQAAIDAAARRLPYGSSTTGSSWPALRAP